MRRPTVARLALTVGVAVAAAPTACSLTTSLDDLTGGGTSGPEAGASDDGRGAGDGVSGGGPDGAGDVAALAPGALDPAFGRGGVTDVDLGAPIEPPVLLGTGADDGTIALAVKTGAPSVGVAWLDANGVVDPAHPNGVTKPFPGAPFDGVYAIRMGHDASLTLGGTTQSFTTGWAMRFAPRGDYDATYGTKQLTVPNAAVVTFHGLLPVGAATSPSGDAIGILHTASADFMHYYVTTASVPATGQPALIGPAFPAPEIAAPGTLYAVTLAGGGYAAAATVYDRDSDFGVLRFDGQGARVQGYGDGTGFSHADVNGYTRDVVSAIACDASGACFVGGKSTSNLTGVSIAAIAKFLPDGAVDTAFAATFVGNVVENATVDALVLTGDRFLVAAGTLAPATDGGVPQGFVARYALDGSLDVAFGQRGVVTVPDLDGIGAAALQGDRRLLAVDAVRLRVARIGL